jgi:urea transport system permease protein
MRVINLAHGEFMMVGAYTAFVVAEFFKAYIPASFFDYYFVLALPLSFLVTGLVGMFCEFAVIRHLMDVRSKRCSQPGGSACC